ncbi:hypothetical protein ILUMI_00187 [Ignelater luminosus]|uniref:HAT C-terminal dimerisation domain-containing protein n=1 Tax=Ignelater luminosus TaxID=2038154 RepID=A0A8K0DKY9_IGNLU|nr:hypothetical protein ILUMI_00187 [Ignelater luminosus]
MDGSVARMVEVGVGVLGNEARSLRKRNDGHHSKAPYDMRDASGRLSIDIIIYGFVASKLTKQLKTIQKVKSYRQSGYDQMKTAANEIEENLECSTEFPVETEVRARRKKRQFDYEEAVDEPLTKENKFKINFFNYILDIILNSLNERFPLLEIHSKNFQLLYDFLKLKHIDDKTLENYCTSRLQSIEELHDVSRMLPYSMKPLDVLNYLCQNNLITLYPNTVVVLRTLLTLPVSVARRERSFFKLKLRVIKHYLRNSISQIKLRNLSFISIASTLAATLDYTSLVNKFAKVKVRRVKLY